MDDKLAQEIHKFDQQPWLPPGLTKTLIRGGLVVLGLSVVASAVLWFKFVSAPSPEEICAHKVALTRSATQDRAQTAGERLVSKLQDRCIENANRRIRLEGKVSYARFARCVISAKNLGETERC